MLDARNRRLFVHASSFDVRLGDDFASGVRFGERSEQTLLTIDRQPRTADY